MKIYGLTVHDAPRFKIVVGAFSCSFHTAKNKTDHGREMLAAGHLHSGLFWEGRSYSGENKIGTLLSFYLNASVEPEDRPKEFAGASKVLKEHGEDVLQPVRTDVNADVYERIYRLNDIAELVNLCVRYKTPSAR